MKNQKVETPKQVVNSGFWKPTEINQFVEGLFNGFSEGEITRGKGKKATVDHPVSILIGGVAVTLTTVLKGFFKPVFKKLVLNKSKIKVQYIGVTEKLYSGKPARLFRVWLNDEEIHSTISGKELQAKELEDFFNS